MAEEGRAGLMQEVKELSGKFHLGVLGFFVVVVVMKMFIHTKQWREMFNGCLPTHFLDMTVVNILPYLFYLFKKFFTKVF